MRRLPLKILPAAFEVWTYLEPSRPIAINPVGVEGILPPGINPRISSSVYGKINTIVFYVPGRQEFKKNRPYCYVNFMVEVIDRMGDLEARHFIVVIEQEYKLPSELTAHLEAITKRQSSTLSIVSIPFVSSTLSPWVQDAFISVQYNVDGEDQIYLVESIVNNRSKDSAKEFLNASGIDNFIFQPSNLPFVGGNILASKRFTLIGLHDTSLQLLEEIGAQWLNQPLVTIASSSKFNEKWSGAYETSDGVLNYHESAAKDQILFHIDLFITLAGRGAQKRNRKTEYLVIGEPEIGFVEGYEKAPKDVQEMVDEMIAETSKGINEIIERITEQLDALNIRFKIERCPLVLTYYDEENEKKKNKRYWCWASYNNSLVEHYYDENGDPIRRIYLPSYGINSNYSIHETNSDLRYGDWSELGGFDKSVKKLWEEKLGYEVIQLQTDYNPFSRRQGSLNCLTNVIERIEPYEN